MSATAGLPEWVLALGAIGAALYGAFLIWKTARAIVHTYDRINMMSQEFRSNGGSTFKDAIGRIDSAAKVAAEKADTAVGVAQDTRKEAMAAANAAKNAAEEARHAATQAAVAVQVAGNAQVEIARLAMVINTIMGTGQSNNAMLHELKGAAMSPATTVVSTGPVEVTPT